MKTRMSNNNDQRITKSRNRYYNNNKNNNRNSNNTTNISSSSSSSPSLFGIVSFVLGTFIFVIVPFIYIITTFIVHRIVLFSTTYVVVNNNNNNNNYLVDDSAALVLLQLQKNFHVVPQQQQQQYEPNIYNYNMTTTTTTAANSNTSTRTNDQYYINTNKDEFVTELRRKVLDLVTGYVQSSLSNDDNRKYNKNKRTTSTWRRNSKSLQEQRHPHNKFYDTTREGQYGFVQQNRYQSTINTRSLIEERSRELIHRFNTMKRKKRIKSRLQFIPIPASTSNTVVQSHNSTNNNNNNNDDDQRIIYFVHVHKAAGTTLCQSAFANGLRTSYKTNCNVQSDQRCCGYSDDVSIQRQYAKTTLYDFVAIEDSMYEQIDPNYYRYIIILRQSYDRYRSHYNHVIRYNHPDYHSRRIGRKHQYYQKQNLTTSTTTTTTTRTTGRRVSTSVFNATRNRFNPRNYSSSSSSSHDSHDRQQQQQYNGTFQDWYKRQPDNFIVRQICGTRCRLNVPKFGITLDQFLFTLHRLLYNFDDLLFVERFTESYIRFANRVGWKLMPLLHVNSTSTNQTSTSTAGSNATQQILRLLASAVDDNEVQELTFPITTKTITNIDADCLGLRQGNRIVKNNNNNNNTNSRCDMILQTMNKRQRKLQQVGQGQGSDTVTKRTVLEQDCASWDPMMSILDDVLYDYAIAKYDGILHSMTDANSSHYYYEIRSYHLDGLYNYFINGPQRNCTNACCATVCSPY